jgi:hypothetical protein
MPRKCFTPHDHDRSGDIPPYIDQAREAELQRRQLEVRLRQVEHELRAAKATLAACAGLLNRYR